MTPIGTQIDPKFMIKLIRNSSYVLKLLSKNASAWRKFTMDDDNLRRKAVISLRKERILFVYTNYISIDITDT